MMNPATAVQIQKHIRLRDFTRDNLKLIKRTVARVSYLTSSST